MLAEIREDMVHRAPSLANDTWRIARGLVLTDLSSRVQQVTRPKRLVAVKAKQAGHAVTENATVVAAC